MKFYQNKKKKDLFFEAFTVFGKTPIFLNNKKKNIYLKNSSFLYISEIWETHPLKKLFPDYTIELYDKTENFSNKSNDSGFSCDDFIKNVYTI